MLSPAQTASTTLFRDQPDVESALKQSLAITYYRQGMPALAEAPQTDALNIREKTLGRGDARTLESLDWSARVLAGRSAEAEDRKRAEATMRQALDARKALLGEKDPGTIFAMRGLGDLLFLQGKLDEALPMYEQALASAKASQPPTSDSVIFSALSLATVLSQKGEPARAVAELTPIRDALRAMKDPDPATQIRVLQNLALAQAQAARITPSPAANEAAERTAREALELSASFHGDEHPTTFIVRDNLASLLLRNGKLQEARPLWEKSVQLGRRSLSPSDPTLLRALNDLGQAMIAAGDATNAAPLIAEAELGYRAGPGIEDRDTQDVVISHARLLLKLGKPGEAIPRLEEVLAQRNASFGGSDIGTIDAARELGRALALARRFADADAAFTKAEAAIDGAKRPLTSDARWGLANQWLHTLKAWAAADPKGSAAGRMPAVSAKIEELRKARLAASPALPVEWKDA
jgi:tetratricopeptide (TPR) repeat protein